MSEEILRIHDLNKDYGMGYQIVQALKNIELHIMKQSFTAIVGRSGSGKSTLLNIIAGLDRPTKGEIFINNKSLLKMKDAERTAFRRRHIGYVHQFFNLIPELTVYENVCLPSYLDCSKPDEVFIDHILKKLGIESKRNKYAFELSGGEQQRVAVARALSLKPDILLADEPTGNLDKKTGDELIELLHFCHQYFGQTILLVTHDLDIARSCDRIITIEDGKIITDTYNMID